MANKGFFEEVARFGMGARGALSSLGGEVERLVKTRLEARLARMRLVSREEFDALKTMAEQARSHGLEMERRLQALEQGKPAQGQRHGQDPTQKLRQKPSKATVKKTSSKKLD